jgi:plasmid stabilization system protein ParE
MEKRPREVWWTIEASARHDETAFDIALQYGEDAGYTYLDRIDQSIGYIQDHPKIGKQIFDSVPQRRKHITSHGWEIVYDDDESRGCVVIIDVQRGSP